MSSSSSRTSYYNPRNPPFSTLGEGLDTTGDRPASGFEGVHLEQIGFVGGLRSHILPEEIVKLERVGIQMAIAEARRAALAPDIAGLASRDLQPDLDFEDVNDNAIQQKEWRQPWSGFYSNNSGEFEVYRTNKDVDYDKKIVAIWGLRYVDSGPGRLGNIVNAAAVTFKDSAGNTYDTWQVEGLDINPELYAFTPIIFSNTRQLRIFNYPKSSNSGGYDTIQFLGKVIERRGDTVNGLARVDYVSSES